MLYKYMTFALCVMITAVKKCLKCLNRNDPKRVSRDAWYWREYRWSYVNARIVTLYARFIGSPRKGNIEFLFFPSSRVNAFPTRRCDNHSTRWTIIDRRLFTLALTRPLCVSYLQRFSEKAPVIDRVLTRKRLFSSYGKGYNIDGNLY